MKRDNTNEEITLRDHRPYTHTLAMEPMLSDSEFVL